MALLGSVIGAAGSILGSGINSIAQNNANKQNIELAKYQMQQNMMLQENAFKDNLDMWNKQNAYNSPSAQMARLKSAGLNPNLVYGSGSVVGNNSGSAPQMKAAEYNAPQMKAYQGWNLGLSDAVGQFMQNQQLKSSLESQATQRDAVKAQIDTERLKQAKIGIDSARSQFDLSQAQRLKDITYRRAEMDMFNSASTNKLINSRYAGQQLDNYIKQELYPLKRAYSESQLNQLSWSIKRLAQDYDLNTFRNSLYRSGITDKDGFVTRVAGRILNNVFGPDFLNSGLDSMFNPK